MAADGRWHWKDLDDVAGQVAAGRLTAEEAAAVWRETERVTSLLDGPPGLVVGGLGVVASPLILSGRW